jgi:hypothetical protein
MVSYRAGVTGLDIKESLRGGKEGPLPLAVAESAFE